MRNTLIIFRRDYREMVVTSAFRTMFVVAAVLTLAVAVGVSVALHLQSWYGEAELLPLVEFFLGLIVYFLPFMILLSFTWGFSGIQITKEKVNGNIECLMATPLGPKALWAGKCLATFVPGFVISLVSVVIALLAVNLSTVLPGWGTFLIPEPVLVTGLIANPVLFGGVLAFIVLFSLAENPDIAIAPAFLVGFGLMIGIPAGMATGVIDIMSWNFVLWYTAGAIVMWIVSLLLLRLLTRQNMVLSSKGN